MSSTVHTLLDPNSIICPQYHAQCTNSKNEWERADIFELDIGQIIKVHEKVSLPEQNECVVMEPFVQTNRQHHLKITYWQNVCLFHSQEIEMTAAIFPHELRNCDECLLQHWAQNNKKKKLFHHANIVSCPFVSLWERNSDDNIKVKHKIMLHRA